METVTSHSFNSFLKQATIALQPGAWRFRMSRKCACLGVTVASLLIFSAASGFAQDTGQSSAQSTNGSQINVNWLYGSYVPKDVPLQPVDGHMRFKLYIRQTYTTWGIYVKTIFFPFTTRCMIHTPSGEMDSRDL